MEVQDDYQSRNSTRRGAQLHFVMENFWSASSLSIITFLILRMCSIGHALDPLDPDGNITVKWDILSFTQDGYNVMVTLSNYQQYRHIEKPGWILGWTWKDNEVIWDMLGAEAIEAGDCSHVEGFNIPHSCKRDPKIVDLLPDVSYALRTANCCRGGVLSSLVQNPANAVSNFRMRVGKATRIHSKNTAVMPSNFILEAPGPGYTCSRPQAQNASHFLSVDGRRHTQAIKTWRISCKYSQVLANPTPMCCVSLSAFYNEAITRCPVCSCGCRDPATNIPKSCLREVSSTDDGDKKNVNKPLLRCSPHMCGVEVHWHLKASYTDHWRAKVTITNYATQANYTDWNLVMQHPNFGSVVRVFSFNYTGLNQINSVTDDSTVMFWGMKNYNNWLLQAGLMGSVQSDILLKKIKGEFSLKNGWAFPRRVYFNGDECVMPEPDVYPRLPRTTPWQRIWSSFLFIISILAGLGFLRFLYYACTFKIKYYSA